MQTSLIVVCVLTCLGLAVGAIAAEPSDDELVDWMTGYFDSGAQPTPTR